jgi:hypothetical protein
MPESRAKTTPRGKVAAIRPPHRMMSLAIEGAAPIG